MEIHAQIFESENLNKQVLVYTNYNTEEDSHELVHRLPLQGASVELKLGGYNSLKECRTALEERTLAIVEKLLTTAIPSNMWKENDEEE